VLAVIWWNRGPDPSAGGEVVRHLSDNCVETWPFSFSLFCMSFGRDSVSCCPLDVVFMPEVVKEEGKQTSGLTEMGCVSLNPQCQYNQPRLVNSWSS